MQAMWKKILKEKNLNCSMIYTEKKPMQTL